MVFIPRWEKYKNKKPAGVAEINYAHELTRGIYLAYFFNENIDSVDLIRPQLFNGAETRAGALHTNSGYVKTYNTYSPASVSGVVRVTPAVMPSAVGYGGIVHKDSAFQIAWNHASPAYQGVLTCNGNGAWPTASFNITNTDKQTLAFTIGNFSMKAYKDGVLQNQNSGLVFTGNTDRLVLANNSYSVTTSNQLAGDFVYDYFYLYDRVLSDAEVAAINEAPYQFLNPRRKWFVFGTSGSTGLSLSDSLSNSIADTISASQTHSLLTNEALSSAFADTITVQAITPADLVLADAVCSSYADSKQITQDHAALLDGSVSSSFADTIAVSLVAAINLILDGAVSSSSADSLLIGYEHSLSTGNALAGSSSEDIALLQSHLLSFADAISTANADVIAVTQDAIVTLIVADALSTASSDSVALTQEHSIQLSGALSSGIADILATTQEHGVVLDGANATAVAQAINALGVALGDIIDPRIRVVTTTKSIEVIKH
jgi:hypothetical protein